MLNNFKKALCGVLITTLFLGILPINTLRHIVADESTFSENATSESTVLEEPKSESTENLSESSTSGGEDFNTEGSTVDNLNSATASSSGLALAEESEPASSTTATEDSSLDGSANINIENKFLFNKETKTILRYLGNEREVVVPASFTHEGVDYAVLHIGDYAFIHGESEANKLTSITLPAGLRSIGEGAFKGEDLTSLSLPASLESVGDFAFFGNELRTLTIPDRSSLVKIGKSSFENNHLSELNLEGLPSLTTIADKSFKNNELETLTLPTTLTTLGTQAFYTNNLREVNVPSNVTNYGQAVFSDNGRFVVIKTTNANLTSQVTARAFGSIVNPVSFYIKGVDAAGKEILSVQKYGNDLNKQLEASEILSVGQNISISGPAIAGYVSEKLEKSPLDQAFIDAHNSSATPYVFTYTRSTDKPHFEGLTSLRVDVGANINYIEGVSAINANGTEIPSSRIKFSPNKIDTSYEAIYNVTYSVIDDAGNKGSAVRTIIVGRDIMQLETGKGWIMGDFTYDENKVTGFSESGLQKLEVNREVVLPTFNPTDLEDLKPITVIGDSAFADKELLTVVLPDNVETIENNAFKGNKLASVSLPETLTTLGNAAFKSNKLTSVELPSSITDLGSEAFMDNNLATVSIPEKVTVIKEATFKNNKLISVDLHEAITEIKDEAFNNNNITSVKLPPVLTTLGASAFKDNKLEEITIPNSVTEAGASVFENNKLRSFSLGTGLSRVSDSMFKNNRLNNFQLPPNITELGVSSFEFNNFATLEIPSTVTVIGNAAFRQNYLLKTVSFNEGLSSIGDEAFHRVDLLVDELIFPSSLRSIGARAFYGSGTKSNIKKIKFAEGLESIGTYAFSDLALEEIKVGDEIGKLPNSLTSVDTHVFRNNNLRRLIVPESITRIPEGFAHNNKLDFLDLGSTVTHIGRDSFSHNNFHELDLKTDTPALVEIDEWAFNHNTNLRKLALPDSLQLIKYRAFNDNHSLSDVSLGSGLKEIANEAFRLNISLTKIILPDGLEKIRHGAFQHAKLTEISIPDSVTVLDNYAFHDNNLSRLKLSNSLTNISANAFESNKLTSVHIPASVERIWRSAFYNNQISSITFEEGSHLTRIDDIVFALNQLNDVVLPPTVTTIEEKAFIHNPGSAQSPRVVRLHIKDANGYVDTNIQDNLYMLVNSTPIKVFSLEEGTDRWIKNPETVFKKIGSTASFVGEANKYYQPASAVATEITVTENPEDIKIYYRKTPEFNPQNIQLDMQFTNPQKAKLGYGLKDDHNKEGHHRSYNEFLVSLKITDEQVLNGGDHYLEFNFDNPNPGGIFNDDELRHTHYNGMSHNNSQLMLDSNYREIFKNVELIRENGNSTKLRLYFKGGALRPNQSYDIGFRYRGDFSAPHNSILDLSGAVSFGLVGAKLPLATTDPNNRIGVRHLRYLPTTYKHAPRFVSVYGPNYVKERNNTLYADQHEPIAEYIISIDTSRSSRTYGYEEIKAIDELPTYEKWDEATNSAVTARAILDETRSTNWRYVAGSDNTKVEFTGPELKKIASFPLFLKFPGIRDRANPANRVDFEGTLSTEPFKVLNGTSEEATAKFNVASPNYETKIPFESRSPANTHTEFHLAKYEVGNTGRGGDYRRDLQVYKRTISFFGGATSNLFKDYKVVNYDWTYNGSTYRHGTGNYRYRNGNSIDGGDWYYYHYMPNTSNYLSRDIVYGMDIIIKHGKGTELVYRDVELDDLLQYKKIGIPEEFKKAKLKLYASRDGSGEPFFTTEIYNDPYELTDSQKERARSYELELDGVSDGTPFTTSHLILYNTVEFKDKNPINMGPNDRYRALKSKAQIKGKVIFDDTDDVVIDSFRSDTETFEVTNSQDLLNEFNKRRAKPGCPNPLRDDESPADCEINNTEGAEIYNGSRISFSYDFAVTGFLDGEYNDFVMYDKLPEGLDFIRFTPNANFTQMLEGYQFETATDAKGRIILKIKADKIRFNERGKTPDTPTRKNITIGTVDAVANAQVKNGQYNNLAYLGIPGINPNDRNRNIKAQLGTKNDADLVATFGDDKYNAVVEGSAPYRVSISTSVLGELTEKVDSSNIWTPFVIHIDEDGNYSYRIRMINQKTNPETSYTVYATLPYNEDINVVTNQNGEYLPRGTHMTGKDDNGTLHVGEMKLRGPISIEDTTKSDEGADPYYEVLYSFSDRASLQRQHPDNLVNDTSIWKTKEQVGTDWGRVTAIKIVTKKAFAPESHDDYILTMKAPDNPNYLFDNLPFSEDFLAAHNIKNNKIIFKFASAPNPVNRVDNATEARRTAFTAGNRVEAHISSPKGRIFIDKRGFNAKKDRPQGIGETEDAFMNRLTPLANATFELYMVGKENVDPASALVNVATHFSELQNLSEFERQKDIPAILNLKIFSEPIHVLSEGQFKTRLTTDDLGKAVFTGLFKNRDYILREVSQPEGYESDIFYKWHFISKESLADSDKQIVNKQILNTTKLHLELKPVRASVSFNKVDTLGNPISFTRFNLVKLNDRVEAGQEEQELKDVYNKTAFTNDSGAIKFDNLPLGKYKLTEVGPRGSLQAIEPIIFFAKRNYTDEDIIVGDDDISDYHYELRFKNPIVNNKAKLNIYKLGIYDVGIQNLVTENRITELKKAGGKPLKDVTLRITSEDGSYTADVVSDSFGKLSFDNLEINKNYLITEPAALDGFNRYEREYKVRVNEIGLIFINDQQSNFEYGVFPNIPTENTNRVDIKKVHEDGENPVPLANATFVLYEVRDDNSLVVLETKQTDAEGNVSFKDFGLNEAGNTPVAKRFKIKETVPPIGYKINLDSEFDFSTNDTTFVYLSKTIENPKIKLVINKSDKETEEPLSDAIFTLYEVNTATDELTAVRHNDENVTARSDRNGVAEFSYDLFDVSKVYAVKETTPPMGYKTNNQVYRFDLLGLSNTTTFNGIFEINITNEHKNSRISVNKFDVDTKRPIEGVQFELTNKRTGEKVANGTTDEDGSLIFENLPFAEYILTETTPALGYAGIDPIEVLTSAEKDNVKVSLSNKRLGTNLVLDKVTSKGHKLKNAKFSLEKSIRGDYHFGTPIYAISDVQGALSFSNLEVGYVYRLREVESETAITPNTEIGASSYELNTSTWFITPKVAGDGTVKLFVRKARETREQEIEGSLSIVNERVEPNPVLVSVSKTLDGGTDLVPARDFRIKLKRGTTADNLLDVPDSEASLVKQEDGTYKYSYRNLDFDVWDETANKWLPYIYEVEELPVEDFTNSITKNVASTPNHLRFDIVNTYSIPKRSIKAKKVWNLGGSNNPTTYLALYRKLLGQETFTLLADSIQEVPAGNKAEFEHTWNNLDVTNKAGRIYEYKVEETDARGVIVDRVDDFIKSLEYDDEQNVHIVRNTYSSPRNKHLIVKKMWVGGPSEKPTIYFRLYRNIAGGEKVAVVDSELSDNQTAIKMMSNGTTQISYTNLTKTDENANEYIYSVVETNAQGEPLNLGALYADETRQDTYNNVKYSYAEPTYDTTSEENTVIVRNTYVIPKTSVDAKKVWINGAKLRPRTWLTLYRKVGEAGNLERVPGENSIQAINTPTTTDETTVTFDNLDLTNDVGTSYIYIVKETDENGVDFVPENYEKNENVAGRDKLVIENTYKSPKTRLNFTKIWRNGAYYRPQASFKLYRHIGDKHEVVPEVDSVVLPEIAREDVTAEDRQEFFFDNIDTHNKDGEAYSFYVREQLAGLNTEGDKEETDKETNESSTVTTGEVAGRVEESADDEDSSLEESELKSIDDTLIPGKYIVSVSEDKREITNSFETNKRNITVKKIWHNITNNRPAIYFKIYRVLDEQVIEKLGLDLENEEEEVNLTTDNITVVDDEEDVSLENKEADEMNEVSAEDASAVVDSSVAESSMSGSEESKAVPHIRIPKTKDKEISIEVRNLPISATNGLPYRYYIKEFDAKTDVEFKDSRFKVEVLDDGLTYKNTYIAPPNEDAIITIEDYLKKHFWKKGKDDKEEEPNNTPNSKRNPKVVNTATKDSPWVYVLLAVLTLAGIFYIYKKERNARKSR